MEALSLLSVIRLELKVQVSARAIECFEGSHSISVATETPQSACLLAVTVVN